MKRSYRFEQGFTYELHVRGVADEQRAAFVEKRDADTSPDERQAHHRRRHRRRAPLRHDDRDRRLGLAPQAHGRRARHLPLGPHRPHRRGVRRPRCRAALRHRQGAQGRVRLRHPRLHRARSALARRAPARPGRGHGGRRGDVLPRPAGGVVAGPLPAHPGRARLRRPHLQPRPAPGALPLRRRPPVPRRPGRRRRRAGRHARPPPRCRHRPHQPGRRRRQRPGARAPTPSSTRSSSGRPSAAS